MEAEGGGGRGLGSRGGSGGQSSQPLMINMNESLHGYEGDQCTHE